MSKSALIVVALVALTLVNIASFKYLGFFGLFVTCASVPFAEKLLGMIGALP